METGRETASKADLKMPVDNHRKPLWGKVVPGGGFEPPTRGFSSGAFHQINQGSAEQAIGNRLYIEAGVLGILETG